MTSILQAEELEVRYQRPAEREVRPIRPELRVSLLTGGQDPHYAWGLAMALVASGVQLEVVGSDLIDSTQMRATPHLRFLNLYGSKGQASIAKKAARVLHSYLRLMGYAAMAKPTILHILWNNRFELFDRTLLMLLYKALGKKVVMTAHNVNAGRRDSKNSLLNRLTLKTQYGLADHIFVHTEKMKNELVDRFHVRKTAVTIIPYGINDAVPDTALTISQAKRQLGLGNAEKAILFFGAIKPYKGLEYLVAAFQRLASADSTYRLIIAGERKKGHEQYWTEIQQMIAHAPSRAQVIRKIQFIPDCETELYFKAADVAVLPYTEIFQSGILFLAYRFGLPVIATDVGSLRDDIVEGETGFLCKPRDPDALAAALLKYFASDLFRDLQQRREDIREYARLRHSWDAVANLTRNAYTGLLA
jgi:D-inositol-3-phosphate glycosyltransferase